MAHLMLGVLPRPLAITQPHNNMPKKNNLEKTQDAIKHLQTLIEKKQEELAQLEEIYNNLKHFLKED